MSLRDLLLTIFLIAGVPFACWYPFIGAAIYAWLGLMNPHRLTWGFAYVVSWAQIYAIATLASMLLTRKAEFLSSIKPFRWPGIYLLWMLLTSLFALVPEFVGYRLEEVLKLYMMAFVSLCVLRTRSEIRFFSIVVASSVAFFGVKGGIFTIATGGSFRVWGPPGSVIEDNNQLAVALTMTVPLLFWMSRTVATRWARWGCLGAILLVLVSIVGSHSRGAFLAILAMSLFLVSHSDRKLPVLLLVLLAAMIILLLMPAEYWGRIRSIGEYQTDPSAQGRINSWIAAFNVANARIAGGGFGFFSGRGIAMFAPDPSPVLNAHSIYFQALGEHGWIGLTLYLAMLASIWRQCGRASKVLDASGDPERLLLLMAMIKVSLVGFVVGGAFVNIGYWDFPLYLLTVAGAALRVAVREKTGAGKRDLVSRP